MAACCTRSRRASRAVATTVTLSCLAVARSDVTSELCMIVLRPSCTHSTAQRGGDGAAWPKENLRPVARDCVITIQRVVRCPGTTTVLRVTSTWHSCVAAIRDQHRRRRVHRRHHASRVLHLSPESAECHPIGWRSVRTTVPRIDAAALFPPIFPLLSPLPPMSSLSAFGFKPAAAAAAASKQNAPASAPDSASPPKNNASSKRVRATAPKSESAAAAARVGAQSKKTQAPAANGKSMVQAMLCFGAAPAAAVAASSSEPIDLSEETSATAAAAASSSSATSTPRRSPRKPTAMESASAASSAAASAAPAARSVLSFVKPAPAPAAAAAAAPKTKKARAPRKRKETAQSSESEADDADEEATEESAVAQPAVSSAKRRKRTEESASSSATATPSRRARASSSAASVSTSAAMIDDDAEAVVIPEEAPRRSGRAAAAGSRQRRSYKEKEENEGLSGGEEEEEGDAVDESASARAAPARPAAAAAAASSAASSPRKGRAVRAGVTAPLFAAPLPAYLAFGTGAVAAAADSYARSQLHRSLSDRPFNILLAMRARSSSAAAHSRGDGGNLPLFYARQRSNGIEMNRATRATMQTLLSHEPVTAIPLPSPAAASLPPAQIAPTAAPAAPTLHSSSFGSTFDQAGLSSLPRMLLARTAPAYRGSSAESGLPIVVRNRWDQGAGAGLTASAFKAYSLNYSPCGRMLAACGHGGVVKVFHRSPAGVAAPRMEQESVCEDNGAVLSPFEADHMTPITSFVAHKRWASSVKFLPNRSSSTSSARSFGDGSGSGSMLLSTSDDSTLKLWSLDSLLAGEIEGAAHALATSSLFVHRPRPLDSLSPHDSLMGIYDFDCLAAGGGGSGETSIATASKDGHVVLSTLTAAGLRRLGSLASGDPDSDSAHRGVVKSVAWRDASILGSAGGNDKVICIYDVRASTGGGGGGSSGRGSCVSRISGLHALSIHTLRWNPSDTCGFQFLTAASDCLIQLCDLRCVGRGPLFTLTQHFPASITRTDAMYKPVFAWEGSMVITASSSQSLHVYSRSVHKRDKDSVHECAGEPV